VRWATQQDLLVDIGYLIGSDGSPPSVNSVRQLLSLAIQDGYARLRGNKTWSSTVVIVMILVDVSGRAIKMRLTPAARP
jgi:hypothetical protein